MKKSLLTSATLGLACIALFGLSACGGKKGIADKSYVARDVETLYNLALSRMEKQRYKEAALIFDDVERQHPYSIWARRAQLMSAFCYYADRQYQDSILAAQRFLSLHPGNRDAPYAYYLIALNYYEQIIGVERDQKTTQQALDALNELVRRYPETTYAADARLKLDLVRDHLTGKEMEVGRFYEKRADYLAALIRFRNVVENYETTSHTPEALHRMVETYLALGMPEEAHKAAAVLGHNFPGSKWYERSNALVRKHGA